MSLAGYENKARAARVVLYILRSPLVARFYRTALTFVCYLIIGGTSVTIANMSLRQFVVAALALLGGAHAASCE